jgi:hypothetical protein
VAHDALLITTERESMSATTMTTVSIQDSAQQVAHPVRRATLVAAVLGTGATAAFAAIAGAAGIPFEVDGEVIPVSGFAMMTLLGAVLGGVIMAVTNRVAAQPRRRFVHITVALTALTCIPSLLSPPDTASKIALVASHVLAAAIIVPVLARSARR